MSEIKLGVKAKDKITGFEGIVTCEVNYLTGCKQYGLTPPVKDGKIDGSEWFDYKRLEYVSEGVKIEEVTDIDNPGGPNRDCPKN